METLLYFLALGLVRLVQSLPLTLVAWIGRRAGGLAWWLDARHRRVALDNLTLAFGGEKTEPAIRELAHEHFRRLGENYASAIKTASMTPAALSRHLQYVGLARFQPATEYEAPKSHIFALGHFGNFELYAWAGHFIPGYQMVTTYRALRQPRLDGLLRSLRQQSGCAVYERRADRDEFMRRLGQPAQFIGLLCDQHAGRGGVWLPFMGRDCSTVVAPAVLALRYRLPLYTAVCFRTGLARWRVEVGDEIPTLADGRRRLPQEIMLDINKALETAIRRDPANWFWVHRRWKPKPAAALP